MIANQHWGLRLSIVHAADGSYRLRHLAASFTIAVERHAPATTLQPLYDAWQTALADLNSVAPPTCDHALQASTHWLLMAVQELLMMYTISVILALAVVGFVVLTVATRSPRLAAAARPHAALRAWFALAPSPSLLASASSSRARARARAAAVSASRCPPRPSAA